MPRSTQLTITSRTNFCRKNKRFFSAILPYEQAQLLHYGRAAPVLFAWILLGVRRAVRDALLLRPLPRVAADAGEDDDIRRVLERILRDVGHGVRQGDALQVRAVREGARANDLQSIRRNDRLNRAVAHERLVIHIERRRGQLHLRQPDARELLGDEALNTICGASAKSVHSPLT